MRRARVTVTVRSDVLAAVEESVAAGNAPSVSAWVDDAMAQKARAEDLTELLAEMQTENGRPDAEEEAWARRVLGL